MEDKAWEVSARVFLGRLLNRGSKRPPCRALGENVEDEEARHHAGKWEDVSGPLVDCYWTWRVFLSVLA